MPSKITGKKLEKDIQREICDWLFAQGYFFWRQNTIPVYEKGHFRALPKYTPRGLPDIMIIHNAKFIGLEVKVPDYWKYTTDQKKIREKIIANGGAYHIVTSLDDAKFLLPQSKKIIPLPDKGNQFDNFLL